VEIGSPPLLLDRDQIGAAIRAENVDAITMNTSNVVIFLVHLDREWDLIVDKAKKES
jgi:hypothetical protein